MNLEEYTTKMFGCTIDELYSKSRMREVVSARQVCMVMLREFTAMSCREIAERYGQTHAMAIHSKHVITNHCDTERDFREKVQRVRDFVNAGMPLIEDYLDEDCKLYSSLV